MLLRPVSPGRREAGKGNRGRLQYWWDSVRFCLRDHYWRNGFVHCDIVVGGAEGSRWDPTATSECRCKGGKGRRHVCGYTEMEGLMRYAKRSTNTHRLY